MWKSLRRGWSRLQSMLSFDSILGGVVKGKYGVDHNGHEMGYSMVG